VEEKRKDKEKREGKEYKVEMGDNVILIKKLSLFYQQPC
jgi:hypothetical protein